MIGTIVQNGLNANHRISGQRPLYHRFLNTLFHCREVVFRNRAAYDYLLEYISVSRSPEGSKVIFT